MDYKELKPNDVIDRLTLISPYVRSTMSHSRRYWNCRCACGRNLSIRADCLKDGNTRSCGCLQKEVAAKLRQKPVGIAGWNQVINRTRNNAFKRGLEYSISDEEMYRMFREPCHYCGAPPNQWMKRKGKRFGLPHNGVDRVDNDCGYVLGNCVACCGFCNQIKSDMPYEEFKMHVALIYLKICEPQPFYFS